MSRGAGDSKELVGRGDEFKGAGLPAPSIQFRRRAWLAFQRALDPLAQPRPLPMRKLPR